MLVLGGVSSARAQPPEDPDAPTDTPEGVTVSNPDAPVLPPWKTRFGAMVDAGAPEGLGASALMRPWRWLRVHAGAAKNSLGFGVRGGLSFTPLELLISPTLDFEGSHYFNADYDKLLTQLRGQPTTTATGIHDVGYNSVSTRLGLEFSPSRYVTLFGGVGLSWWFIQVDDVKSFIRDAAEDPDITAEPLDSPNHQPGAEAGPHRLFQLNGSCPMRALPRVLLLCVTTLLTTGCREIADTFFFVDLETEEICKTERSLAFPASPEGTTPLEQTLLFPLGQVGAEFPEGRLDTQFRLRLFEIDVTGGEADLTGIEYAKVSLRRTGSAEVIRTLLEYRRPAQVFSTTRLSLRGVEAVQVPELAREDQVELVFEASGDLPRQAWTADVRACAGLFGRAHYFDVIF